ncbi:MAG: hypothetical protein HRT71_12295 [Flavobacteriales bacterium]|nr:hypothetical protein [Flavobacteriales bacterium]
MITYSIHYSTVLKWIRKFEKEDILSVSMTKEKSKEYLSNEEALAKINVLKEALRLTEIKAAG